MSTIKSIIGTKVLVMDGAMGTQIQAQTIPEDVWQNKNGCNELLNKTYPDLISKIHSAYLKAGADIIKTNTFGSMPWVLDEYGIGDISYELSYLGAKLVKDECVKFYTKNKPRFVAGSIGPGTKLPSLGHIDFKTIYEGYKVAIKGLVDGGVDLFLLETCQDPLQIKAAILACKDVAPTIPIMVSVTIELNGTMLIGTDTKTVATILEPFDILSLGFNCGTGPIQVKKHVKTLSELYGGYISVHANAGLPQNRGGHTFYPMGPDEFTKLQTEFLSYAGVAVLGGCCGTTPQHIKALSDAVNSHEVLRPKGKQPKSLASLFETKELHQNPAPFLIGERSNATGSKAFRELLLAEDYDGTMNIANEQVRSGAHGIDISVGFAGRDESKDMKIVASLYSSKITLPLMIDSTQIKALEVGLQNVGGRAIVNSVNLEDGIEKFDKICSLAKRYGAALVCLTIDENGMAKTKEQKVAIANRIYELATKKHNFDDEDLVFDMLTFTVGSGDEEYFTAAIETIEAIREFHKMYPKVGFVLGISNISFGLSKHSREYLNSIFLHHCVEAGLSMAIVNVKLTMPLHKISDEDREYCEDLLFNRRDEKGDVLMHFIEHFSDKSAVVEQDDEKFEKLSTKEKLHFLLVEGDKQRMLTLLPNAKDEIDAENIINEILINAMKEVGELFGSGKMQLPFVLQSAEVMKAAVNYLEPYLPKSDKKTKTTLILGTVKGDVHDVGKNLVDIILSNNGFNVINIGIKADIDDFVKAYRDNKADAIGMSGLLVKSTAIMQENLEELKQRGINAPVLLGGAALTSKFVDEFCRPKYDGAIFYCKDAFDGIESMSRIEKGNLDTSLHKIDNEQKPTTKHQPLSIPPYEQISMPKKVNIPTPPFWGRKVLRYDVSKIAYDWINKKVLFSQRWGYSGKGLSKDEKKEQRENIIEPLYNSLIDLIDKEALFDPVMIYGYFKCKSYKDELIIFDENLQEISRIKFPRQRKKPYRALSDYFSSDKYDVIALSCVSAGNKFSEYEKKLYDNGDFQDYFRLHGIGVELAEALAEIVHKQVRLDLDIAQNEGGTIRDVQMNKYRGSRYSFGYPACPELSDNKIIFDLLRPEEFGIELSESFQIHPEQSTTALIVHHPNAIYYRTL